MTFAPFSLVERDEQGRVKRVVPLHLITMKPPAWNNQVAERRRLKNLTRLQRRRLK